MFSKSELRQKFKALLLSRREHSQDSTSDAKHYRQYLTKFFKDRKGSWGAFYPLDDEPPILSSLTEIPHIDWFFPRVRGDVLEFANGIELQRHDLGFTQPQNGEVKAADELDGFLIPGLAFDRKGQRLGRGKGYYDRSLQASSGTRVGVCYQVQLVDQLEVAEAHDLAMDYVLTENETVTCGSRVKGS